MLNNFKKLLLAASSVAVICAASPAFAGPSGMAPGSVLFFGNIWAFAQQALQAGNLNQATLWCYSYVGQTWPDPAANAIAPRLAEACQKAVQTGGLTYYPTWAL